MAQTSIEWTQKKLAIKAGVSEGDSVQQKFAGPQSTPLHPIEDILIVLGAVARAAGGDNVARRGAAPAGNGSNVIPSCGRGPAVGTFAVEEFEQEFLSFGRHSFHFPFSPINRCLNSMPIFRIAGVTCADDRRSTRSALAIANRARRKPLLTTRTPLKAKPAVHPSISERRRSRSPCRSTIQTGRIAPVIPAPILTEMGDLPPSAAFLAPLLAPMDVGHVVIKGNTESLCCGLECPDIAAHAHSI